MSQAERATRVALVTGASRGIGAAIAEALGAAGHSVVVNYRTDRDGAESVVGRIRTAGGSATAMRADVSVREEVSALFRQVEHDVGFVTCLVNNAGVTRDVPLMLMGDDEWREVIATNLGSTYLCAQAALRGMMHAGGGSIVNIVSPSGVRGQAGQVNYSAAKGGVIAFTRALAREMGRHRVRVNAVCPGVVETRMARHYIEKQGAELLSAIPLRRFGTPADVAPLVVFLASDAASYITAQVVSVDGGLL